MSQLENQSASPVPEAASVSAENRSNPRKALEAAATAWEQAKQQLEQAYQDYQPLRELRQSDEPFSGDWWRYCYMPALEQLLWAIEQEKSAKAACEEAEETYRWSNQGLEDFADSSELANDWRDQF